MYRSGDDDGVHLEGRPEYELDGIPGHVAFREKDVQLVGSEDGGSEGE